MRGAAQLHLSGVGFARPERTIIDDLDLTVSPGDRIGLTGPNGAGKSTLLALAASLLTPTAGSVSAVPPTATVGLLGQELDPRSGETVREWIERRIGVTEASVELERATAALANASDSAADAYDDALQAWLRLGAATLDERLPPALADLGFDPQRVDEPAEVMSGGERARVGLAALTLAEFDILLLDEPTNDLDLAGIARLERFLSDTSSPFVLVSHDRRLLERSVNAVVEIDPHTLRCHRFAGGWAAYLEERAIARSHEERDFGDYVSKKQRLEGRARTERAWSTKGTNKAKKGAPDNDKNSRSFHMEASENLAAKARRTEKAIERLDVVDKPWEPWRLEFDFGEADRSGDVVVDLAEAVIERGSFSLGPIDLTIRSGDRCHLAGANGAGKTTLLRAVMGELSLVRGERRVGPSVTFGLIDQTRSFSSPPIAYVEAETGATLQECRSTLAKFGLTADHVSRAPAELSPGERTRTLLAVFQLRGVNTVVLDEPTNHLDIEAIEQLESALERFQGTLIVVTHDRAFLENIAIDRTVNVG